MFIAEPLVREREYNELRLELDPDHSVHWCYMHRRRAAATRHRPCFHLFLLREILEYQERLGNALMKLEEKMAELKRAFGLTDEELNLNLGPLKMWE